MSEPAQNLPQKLVIVCALASIALIIWSRDNGRSTWKSVEPPPGAYSWNKPATDMPDTAGTSGTGEIVKSGSVAPLPTNVPPPPGDSDAAPDSGDDAAASPTPAVANPSPAKLATTKPQPSVSPSDAELAGPLPDKPPAPANPAPQDAVIPDTPTPTPTPPQVLAASLDIQAISSRRQLWPPRVILQQPVRFPMIIDGHEVGNVKIPAGSVVNLRKVLPDGSVEIERQGSVATTPATTTDILARARAAAAAAPSLASGTDSANAPATTGSADPAAAKVTQAPTPQSASPQVAAPPAPVAAIATAPSATLGPPSSSAKATPASLAPAPIPAATPAASAPDDTGGTE